jgi:hypothetical protein
MGIFTSRWLFKKNQPDIFAQIFKDCFSSRPEQNGLKKLGVTQPYKIYIVSMGRRGNL